MKNESDSLTEKANDALRQISSLDYSARLRELGVTDIRAIGMAFYKKKSVITDELQ